MGTTNNKKFRTFRKVLQSPMKFGALFFEQTGVHGLAYFVKSTLHWIEKFIWITLVITSLAYCIFLSLESLNRYNTKSVVVSLEKDHYYWNTSLASITICPLEQRINDNKFDEYCRNNRINGHLKKDLKIFLESLANSTYFNFQDMKATDSIKGLNINPQEYMELIYNLTDDFSRREPEDVRVRTQSDKEYVHTQQVLTEYGICYITNNFLSENISAQYLLTGQYPSENAYENSYKPNVHFLFYGNLFDGEVSFSFIGFNVSIAIFVHSPYEVVHIGKTFGQYYATNVIEFETQSLEILTTEDLEEDTSISQRNCRFSWESNLTHFPVYTKNLCLQECRVKHAIKKCGCIPHFYPNRIRNPKRVCNYEELRTCFPPLADEFIQMKNMSDDCFCLQNCKESKITVDNIQVMGDSQDLVGSYGALILVKKFPLVRFKRQILFSFTDFLVSIGGTAGFFLGFSVLGAVEIIYFFTLRCFWYFREHK